MRYLLVDQVAGSDESEAGERRKFLRSVRHGAAGSSGRGRSGGTRRSKQDIIR
jgi:hypothetical protein